jgi:hypothetical protein
MSAVVSGGAEDALESFWRSNPIGLRSRAADFCSARMQEPDVGSSALMELVRCGRIVGSAAAIAVEEMRYRARVGWTVLELA